MTDTTTVVETEIEPTNKYELAEWIQKTVLKRVNESLKQEKAQLDSYKEKLQKKYEAVSESLRQIQSTTEAYSRSLKAHEDKITTQEKALSDRRGNLQHIYDKMIRIEQMLQRGEWPGILPPLDLNFEDEKDD
jgi:predicted  nucleic acid-binding Zn-ribbon protein